MKNSCLVCGSKLNSEQYGYYCTKECRDSELGILGKTCVCEDCGKEFKSFTVMHCCDSCMEAKRTNIVESYDIKGSLSPFEYSIFEDNLNRIMQASDIGDKRNCIHALHKITETIKSSKISDMLSNTHASSEETFKLLNKIACRVNNNFLIRDLEKLLLPK